MRLVSDNASRVCSVAGEWAERTDYSHCRQLDPATPAPDTAALPAHLEISIVIYLIGAAESQWVNISAKLEEKINPVNT